MTAKNLFLLGLMVFLLSACGGSDETAQQNSEQLPVEQVTPTPSATPINLTGIAGNSIVTKTQVSGAVASSRGVVGTTVANSQATITLSQVNEVIQGNITFLLSVSDPDGISAVNLVLPSVNKSLALCTQACGTAFEQSVIGLSPYFYGVESGDLRLEIWITDSLNNQVLADAVTTNWQPYQIEGISAQRDGQSINLSWQANDNLNRYNIYLATEAGVTTSNVNTLENGQQFLSISGTSFNVDDLLADKSYQVLITGVDGSGESGFAEKINVAPLGGELNFAPNAVNDQFLVNEDQSLQGNVLINDTDEYQGTLYINTNPLVNPQHGSVALSESGDFTYTPRANFNGNDAFSYQVINELGMIDTGIVEITINAVNDAPIALDNTYNISDDGTLLIAAPGLLSNDSDIDQDQLTLDTTPVSLPSKGALTLASDGSFEYIGSANMQGADSFQYRIVDPQGAEAIASVTINAQDQNSPPTAVNDSYSLDEDTTLVVDTSQGLLANDTDPNNDTFIIDDTYSVTPAHGQLQLATDGSFSYIPDANYYGIDEFKYQVIDTLGATATATATLTINSTPDNPNAQKDEYQFQYNQTLVVSAENGLLKNDVNIEPGNLTVNTTPVVNVQSGILTLNADGSFSYQPNSDALDVDSFTYSVSNEQGLTATAQVVLNKTGSNSPAEANDDFYTLLEDSPATLLNVLENDTDANGDTLTLTDVTNTIGTVRIVNNRIEYTPEPDYFGEAILNYSISDGFSDSTPVQSNATVTITITPVNDAPTAMADSAAMQEDAPPILVDVLTNDTDVDGDNLTITSVSTEFGSASIADNKIQYSAGPNANGVAIVTYSISDNSAGEASATLEITISPVNDAPIVNADSVTITEDASATLIDVLSNDTDIDGDTLTLSTVSSDSGSVSIVNSQIQYIPDENDNGTATVNYTITDGSQSASGILTITITPVNDAPVANADTATILEDAAPTSINVVGNDTDVDNDPLAISTASTSTGAVSVSGSNLLYTPEANFNGQTVVSYTLTDGTTTAEGVLTITVTAVNDAPIANPDSATILEDAAATSINVLSNDTDIENDTLSISALTTTSGAVTSAGSDVIYTPEANFNGQATVNYTLSDGTDTANGVLTITVTPVNDAPVANPDTATILEDAVTTNIDVLNNDTDVENDSLSISSASASTGSVTVAGSNLAFTPEADFNGQAVINYSLSDGTDTASGVLTITVTPVNDAPVANPDTATILEDAAATSINVLSNDTDIENDTLSISAVTTTSGTVTSAGSDVIYTPEANFNGQATVNYTLSDGTDTANGVLTITVTPINDTPVANPDTATILEDAAATSINVLSNDTDAENDTLSISAVTATSGTVTSAGNDVIYTPEANFNGQATVNYTLSDGTDTANGVLTITVTPVNDAPVANPDAATILEDAAATSINVLSNDTDTENDTLSITSVSTNVGGISSSGNNVIYTPETNFHGQVIVNYTLSDGTDTAPGTLTINVTPVNDAPVAQPDSATLNEDAPETTIDVISNDSDADATDTLTITAVIADIGTASVENNEIKYTPALNSESIATLTYTLSDGTDEVQGNLTITIVAINDAPTAVDQTFSIGENAIDEETIGTITASDIENNSLTFSLSGGETSLFNIDSNSGLLTVNGSNAFNFETATQHTVNVDITDNGSPNETTTITINVNITDEEDPLIPVEDETFGRALSEQLDLSSVFSNGEFNDSIELNTNLYFVGYNNNTDTDIIVVSYTNTGDLNTAFNSSGFKTIDLGEDEKGTAIISGNGELFIGYSSFNGSETEACLLKMSTTGIISTNSGDANSGTKCTTLGSESVINDLEFTDNKIQGVGYSINGSDKDSLFLKFDVSTLAYESGSPGIVDVSGENRDDESHAIKNFGNSDLLVVGSAIGEEGDLDATIRYLIPDGNNNGSFNSGDALILDLSDEEGDDELLAIGGIDAVNFTAYLGGYFTRSSGEKEAVMISVDRFGDINEEMSIYNIDGNSGSSNGSARVTGVKYAPLSNQIILSGTTGIEATDDAHNEQLFSARVSVPDGTLDTSYGNSGINIISNVISHQTANASTIDENGTLWLSGRFNDSSNEPFITSITSNANLNTDFSIDGYTSLNDLSISSNDLSMDVLQLQTGTHADKYLTASVTQLNTNNKLVLTRYTNAGVIDTSFSLDGNKALDINVAFKTIKIKELSDSSIIIAGTLINGVNEEGFIAKVDQDGYLDKNFADEGIYTTVDILNTDISFADVAIDSSGYIVAVGTATNALSVTNSFATMLKSDGKLENSFGTSGAYYGNVNEFFETLYIDANKDIYIAGKQVSGSSSQLTMLKIDDDANEIFTYTDSRSFSDINNRATKILADNAANLYLIANDGTTPNLAVIIKLQPDGSEDLSFATSGIGQYELASSADTKVNDAAIDTNGNIILSGMSDSKGLIARILADGTIDTLFGENMRGYYQAVQCDGTHEFTSMLLQTNNQIILNSTCFNNGSNNVSLSKFNFYPDGIKP
ncbi:Ig-like domain-containing protein [Pseudoalteromonas sp. P1-25]|uniref:beta strand repeat-containing protein n=1 Tax=Pseudoalteromonas sp. P1-25 TaxID=1723758 RepID=UPI0006D6762F|nr:Ig-like domain-containing protein [Pseudoalteromonas sp. P1-25]KPZ52489.1 hypothetical protein AN393_03320 [Pseudoalteromonas sp. P1-25]